jgi:hypothetical protein
MMGFRTGDLRAVRTLPEQGRIKATVRYPGVYMEGAPWLPELTGISRPGL